MIRKFAAVPGFGIAMLAMTLMAFSGATPVVAQQQSSQDPAQQSPAAAQAQPQDTQQQPNAPTNQEATEQEIGANRKPKPHPFNNWDFNVGGGASLTSGTTTQFARGGGGVAAAGVAHNYSQYFGFRLDFQWDNLPLRSSALQLAQAPSATSYAYMLSFGPIINIPVTPEWGGYIVFGPNYIRRSGKLDSSQVLQGSACNNFFAWWGTCFNGSIPYNKQYLSTTQNEFGYNFGGGITRKLTPKFELYGEFRIVHGSGGGRTTDFRPVTVGLRF